MLPRNGYLHEMNHGNAAVRFKKPWGGCLVITGSKIRNFGNIFNNSDTYLIISKLLMVLFREWFVQNLDITKTDRKHVAPWQSTYKTSSWRFTRHTEWIIPTPWLVDRSSVIILYQNRRVKMIPHFNILNDMYWSYTSIVTVVLTS